MFLFFFSFLQPNINANARKQVGLTGKKILNESGAPTDRFAHEIRSAGIFEREKAANNIVGTGGGGWLVHPPPPPVWE